MRAQRTNEKGARWSDVCTKLIAYGHCQERIRHYTFRQMYLYYEAAIRHECEQRANSTVDSTYAMAKPEEVKKHVHDLTSM